MSASRIQFLFVNLIEDRHHCVLDDLVFQRKLRGWAVEVKVKVLSAAVM